ncbi:cathepsin 7-like, partial [Trifolium medium]|nr:cathepsin 7-like [Trifolium medium]
IIHNGCVLEASCRYTGKLQPPRPLWEREVRLRFEASIPIKLENIETYIRRKREPVMASLDWIDEIMDELGDEAEGHGLLIVGFGPDYWLVQYSHETDWGNGGYAKFTRAQVHGRFLINDGWAAAGIKYEDLNRNAYHAT